MNEPGASSSDGWIRFHVRSSGVLQHDLSVSRDESFENEVFSVAGDKHGAKILDADGVVVMTAVVTKALLARVEYLDSNGAVVARLERNSVFNKKHMELTLAGAVEWIVVKSGRLKQFYSVFQNETPLAKMDLKTLPLKHHYPIEIAEGVDLPLAVGLVWAINFSHLRRVAGAGAGAVGAT